MIRGPSAGIHENVEADHDSEERGTFHHEVHLSLTRGERDRAKIGEGICKVQAKRHRAHQKRHSVGGHLMS